MNQKKDDFELRHIIIYETEPRMQLFNPAPGEDSKSDSVFTIPELQLYAGV